MTKKWRQTEHDRWRQPVLPRRRQLGNDTTYDTEKKNPTSHDVADTLALSGQRVGKTRNHVVKTNCGRHLKRRHFQLSRVSSHLKVLLRTP
jgi:hypothetical protein